MSYTLDVIYKLAGRGDKVAVLTFDPDSESFKIYGESLTVVFHYDQFEREKFEKRFQEKIDEGTLGSIKARYLGFELPKKKIESLKKDGINSKDILSIFQSWSHKNLYHKEDKRTIDTLEIPLHRKAKGGDYNWMYGFKRKIVNDGCELFPYEKDFYLAMKMHFEEDKLSDPEKEYVYDNSILKESIERHLLDIKLEKEIITPEEEKRWEEIYLKFMEGNLDKLKQELQDAGSNLAKLYSQNTGLYKHLMTGTYKYIPERLNGLKGKPIYLDWNGYLHVFIRHVEEFKINNAYENKDKFLWDPKDILTVIHKVIENVDDEIQGFWKVNPGQRFSKYGAQSLYFEGDYYTFHVEGDGRLSTFHRNRKNFNKNN